MTISIVFFIQHGPEVVPGEGTPGTSADLCRSHTGSPHYRHQQHPAAITDTINLTQGSPSSTTFSPNSHTDDTPVNRPAFSENSGSGAGSNLPPSKGILHFMPHYVVLIDQSVGGIFEVLVA